MKNLAILGASGHGKVVADAALCAGWDRIVFFDDNWLNLKNVNKMPIEGDESSFFSRAADFNGRVVAIGNNEQRFKKAVQLKDLGLALTTIVHPAAVVSQFSTLGSGCVIFAGAIINSNAKLGDYCIVNTGATIDHDCIIEDAVHISPGVHLAGDVRVGALSWVGIGASVRQKIKIGSHVMVGAGTVVIQDIEDYSTVIGVPGKKI